MRGSKMRTKARGGRERPHRRGYGRSLLLPQRLLTPSGRLSPTDDHLAAQKVQGCGAGTR